MSNMSLRRKFLSGSIVKDCVEYYEQNDIFLAKNSEYFAAKRELLAKKNVLYEDLQQFIENTRGNNCTKFGRYNKNKVLVRPCETDIYFKNTLYIKPDLWNKNLYTDMVNILKEEKKDNLILDLRGCNGGYLRQCINICKLFLSESEIVSLRYIDKIITYCSKEQRYTFDNIFILIDRRTASSAEILAYSLYTNLENVRLLGEKTFGKTFGQDYITNDKYGFYLSVPSFRWSIKGFSMEQAKITHCDSPLSVIESLIFES